MERPILARSGLTESMNYLVSSIVFGSHWHGDWATSFDLDEVMGLRSRKGRQQFELVRRASSKIEPVRPENSPPVGFLAQQFSVLVGFSASLRLALFALSALR
ncbi:MAG: hypothetical protein ACTS5I_06070 [Rhodanobacter sp.]